MQNTFKSPARLLNKAHRIDTNGMSELCEYVTHGYICDRGHIFMNFTSFELLVITFIGL